ncbi:MAG: MarR family transcriptional regulator [Desulfobacteraceae bacterium]|nr:MAG: MarR family transcriptional regulator [Desulfobacteraceae bacterium]
MKFDRETFKRENSPGYIIHRLDSLLKLSLQRAFQSEGFDFTAEQWGVLLRLYESEGIHQSELSARAGKDRHNITRILNGLEKNGYVRRVPDKRDTRRLNIFLTRKSRDIEERLFSIVIDLLERAFAGLSKKDIREMRRIHNHIIANVESFLE